MKRKDTDDIRAALRGYADVMDGASRTSARALVLSKLDDLSLSPRKVSTRRLTPEELRRDRFLRGALAVHFDLVFRATVTGAELDETARRGIARVAMHPDVEGFPVGALLALPTRGLLEHREQLFSGPDLSDADTLVVFALATNPGGLGAGVALMRDVLLDAARERPAKKVVAFSPLSGLRARAIRWVEDADTDEALREELSDLLNLEGLPPALPPLAAEWIFRESRDLAASPEYRTGAFHRALGARYLDVQNSADPLATDALWSRVWYDYPLPSC